MTMPAKQELPWQQWREHFENQQHRRSPTLVKPYGLSQEWSNALTYSLARFQIGESGEGRIAHEIDGVQNAVVDADYRAALKLFVKEEGRHRRILADMIHALGGKLLRKTWTDQLFTWGRRSMGLHLKLLVLLVAEVIGLGFYSFVKDRLPSGTFRAALKEIIDDESFHLVFHMEYFRRVLTSPAKRLLFQLTWWTISLTACTVVYIDHRSTWKTFRVPFFSSAGRLLFLIHETKEVILKKDLLAPESAHAWA